MVENNKDKNHRFDSLYLKFAFFSLSLLFKASICELTNKEAIASIENFFLENANIDDRFKDILLTFIYEWDNTKDLMCNFVTYVTQASSFKELEQLLSRDPELWDNFYN